MRIATGSPRTEHGATAIFVAILATLMLSVAALAVDLGNAWARKRDVQTQVDVSALSAGHLLPQSAANENAILVEVASFLNRSNNKAVGQPDVTVAQLSDNDPANGEVIFSNSGKTMRVIAPGARVDFSFAGVIGEDGTDVQAEAIVELQSPLPPRGKVLPFAIPDQCPFGPGMADTGPGGSNSNVDTSGSWTPPTGAREGHIATFSPSSVESGGTSPVPVTMSLSALPKDVSTAQIEFRIGAEVRSVNVSFPVTTANNQTRNVDSFDVPGDVLATPGTWTVWGVVKSKYTDNTVTLTVGEPTPNSEIGCSASASGEFGQMFSPRGNQNPDQRGLALNIAEGLDHNIYPYIGATDNECGNKTQDPPTGGIQDKPNANRPNCILPQTGNDGPWMLQGLITGIDGTLGRLDASRTNGDTTCGPPADRTGNVTREGVEINNDVLSCFLKPGYRLDDLAQPTLTEEQAAEMLDRTVVNSPRFMWIPVIYAPTRADIDNNTFYKLKRFVPAFLTDESRAATNASSDATADNGVVIGGQLESLQIFMFNALALPVDERGPTTEYDPLLGRVVRLIG